jgi:hypothetical protein
MENHCIGAGMLNIDSLPKTFKFYHDAGHGWLCVPRTLIQFLGLSSEITEYSYFDQENIYLEEDYDAGLFDQAMKEKLPFHKYDTVAIYHDHSPIRNKARTR